MGPRFRECICPKMCCILSSVAVLLMRVNLSPLALSSPVILTVVNVVHNVC